MDLNGFSTNYLSNLLVKVSKERKSVFSLGGFIIVNLLNYINLNPTNDFLDSLVCNTFVPYILQPTWITYYSKTFIDNIFSDIVFPEAISANLTSTISDLLPRPRQITYVYTQRTRNYMFNKLMYLIIF